MSTPLNFARNGKNMPPVKVIPFKEKGKIEAFHK